MTLSTQQIIKNLTRVSKKQWQSFIIKNSDYDSFLKETFPEARSLKERLFLLEHEMTAVPKCSNNKCSNLVNFYENRYSATCSRVCSVEHQKQTGVFSAKLEKRKKTCIEVYGVEHPAQNQVVQHKSRETCIEKYGVDNAIKNDKIKEKQKAAINSRNDEEWDTILKKRQKTCLDTYGVESPMTSAHIQEKIKKTCLTRYGDEHFFRSGHFIEKSKESCFDKYGEAQYFLTDDFRNKSKISMLEKYGVENIFSADVFPDMRKKKCLEKYNVDHYTKSDEFLEPRRKEFYNTLADRNPNITPNFTIDEYTNTDAHLSWHCDVCGDDFLDHMNNGRTPICRICNPLCRSVAEKDIIDFIRSVYTGELITSDRKKISPLELDIFIPPLNLAIEYNGLYWHSDARQTDKNYHLKKLNMCLDQKIKLISIFEDEWVHKQDMVKNRLRHALHVNSKNTIFARNTEIRLISRQLGNEFLNANHIMGCGNNKLFYGLFSKIDQTLVSVMSFSNKNISRKNNGIWEINRFASLTEYNIAGGGGKLFAQFIKDVNPDQVISYADRRWGNGDFYKNLNFVFDSFTPINYWYVSGTKRIHRYSMRKNKNDIQDLTEYENRKLQGYGRIWDCGSSKWVWYKP